MEQIQQENKIKTLYKYRSLKNFHFFVDILLYNRLYAAKYTDMNDPMEGIYYYNSGKLNEDIRKKLSGEKERLKICSLSEANDNILMWSHYADSHKGVAIGIQIEDRKYEIRPIQYDGYSYISDNNYCNQSAKAILTHKADVWSYEKENRVFCDNNYIDVKIVEIITGIKMETKEISLLKKLVEKINPDIKIINGKTIIK
jgi:hypothetical protein